MKFEALCALLLNRGQQGLVSESVWVGPHFPPNSVENLFTSEHKKSSLDTLVTRHQPLAGYLFLPPSTHCPPSPAFLFLPCWIINLPSWPENPMLCGYGARDPGKSFLGSDEDKPAFEGKASEEQSQRQKQSQFLLAWCASQGRGPLTITAESRRQPVSLPTQRQA